MLWCRQATNGIGGDSGPGQRLVTAYLFFLVALIVLPDGSFAAEMGGDPTGPVKITKIEDQSLVVQSPVLTPSAATCHFEQPPPAAEGEATVRRIAKEEHFDVDLTVAIARRESGFRMDAVSSAGAIGLMQLMPATARRFEVDICDPEDNVRGGVRYLKLLEKRYANPLYMLAAYNAGEGAVDENRGIPLYPETVNYVAAIMTDLYGWQSFRDSSIAAGSVGRQPKAAASEKPDADSPEAWSQGFVLHVE